MKRLDDKMKRFTHFNAEPIPLGDGLNPPAIHLKQPWEIPCDLPSRNCIDCGKIHNMVVTDTVMETHKPLDKCYECIMKGCIYIPPTEKIHLTCDQ